MNIKIPPAYKNVYIYPEGKNKKILAYGFDEKNRKQVIYNPEYVKSQHQKKYNKILKLNKIFKIIKDDVNNNINISTNYDKNYEISIIIYFIINCGFRIGNEKYKCENNSFGITTLQYNHLKFSKNKLIIDFIGKKGVRNISECSNIKIINYLKKNKKNCNNNDKVFKCSSSDVNNFLKEYNPKITSKDLRTWNANNMLLEFIKLPEIKNSKNPIKKAIEKVSEKLHNSYHICLKSYINPVLIDKLKFK
jgi:DNA topoisomerase-1